MNSPQPFRAFVCGLLIGCLLAGSLTGCASMPKTGQPSNGQQLRIVDRRIDDSRYEDVEVGKSDHYNSNGDYTGTSVQTQTQFVRDSHMEYHLLQGSAPIDAQDFMRISGDLQGAANLEKDRKRGVWLNRAGFPVAAVGTVIAYIGIQMKAKSTGKSSYNTLLGGSLTASTGGLMIIWGQFMARPLKVLNGKRSQDMRTLDRLVEDMKRPPAQIQESTSPAPSPTSSMAPAESASPGEDLVAKYATGTIPVAALRLVDAGGKVLVESDAEGNLWKGAPPERIGSVRAAVVSLSSKPLTVAIGRDGSVTAFRGTEAPDRMGALDPAGVYRSKVGNTFQVLQDGRIQRVEKGKGRIVQPRFTAPVPPRARALAALLAAMFANS